MFRKGRHEKNMRTSNKILIILGIALTAFTIEMINVFKQYGMIPDTLVTCVFAALTGELGIMGWIRTTKERKKEREWQLEDEKRNREYMKEDMENIHK